MFLSPLKNLARKGLKLLSQCLRGNELFPLSMDQVWDGTKSLQFQEFSANEYVGISKNKMEYYIVEHYRSLNRLSLYLHVKFPSVCITSYFYVVMET